MDLQSYTVLYIMPCMHFYVSAFVSLKYHSALLIKDLLKLAIVQNQQKDMFFMPDPKHCFSPEVKFSRVMGKKCF